MGARFSQFWADNEAKLIAAVEHEMAGQSLMPQGGWDRVGKAVGMPGDSCAQKYRRIRQGSVVATQAPPKLPTTIKDVHDFIDMPPRPFQVPILKPAAPVAGKPFRAVVIGDRQVPFDDPAALKVALAVIKDVQPHVLVDMGDATDCWQISDYDRDPHRMGSLQDDLDKSKTTLHQLAQAAPKARRVLLEGNHEDRLRRMIWRLPGSAAELNRLRVFQQTMTWPFLLGLSEIGWEWVPTDLQSRTTVLPKLVTIHGHQLRGATTVEGAAARKAIQKYGRSVVVAHHHRACVLTRRDHNGQTFGIETGCLCLLDGQPYGMDFNWQQAITVFEWTANRRVMAVTQIHVRDGKALWRGTELAA